MYETLEREEVYKKLKSSLHASVEEKTNGEPSSLDLCIVVDGTASMREEIGRIKEQVRQVTALLTKLMETRFNEYSRVRISFALYRDHQKSHRDDPHLEGMNFTDDLETFSEYFSSVNAKGGRGPPADVLVRTFNMR